MQKSIREGFGLTVTEALWKGRPTIAGDVGGIPLQIEDGGPGYLVSSPGGGGAAHDRDPADPELAKRLGRAGKEHAREHFLTPRLLRDWLQIFTDLDGAATCPRSLGSPRWREQPLIIVSNRGPAQFERDEARRARSSAAAAAAW